MFILKRCFTLGHLFSTTAKISLILFFCFHLKCFFPSQFTTLPAHFPFFPLFLFCQVYSNERTLGVGFSVSCFMILKKKEGNQQSKLKN